MAQTLSYQTGILTVGRSLAYMAMFFVPIINVRVLSQNDYGVYRQFWLLFETMAVFMVLAFPNSLFYFLPRAENKRVKAVYVTQTLVFLTLMGFVSWGVYGVLKMVLSEGLGGVVKEYFWAFCLFTLGMVVSRYMEYIFVAEKKAERQSLYHLIVHILQALLVMSLSWFTRNISVMIWGLTGYALLKLLFTMFYTRSAYGIVLRSISLQSMRDQFSYALPLGLSAIVMMLFTQTDKYIITHYMGASFFAIYSIGSFQVPFVNIIRGSVTNITFPLMAEYQKEGRLKEILSLYQRATLKSAVLFYPIFIFLVASAREFITILFTDKYERAAPVFLLYLLLFLRSTVETGSIMMVFKKNIFLFKVFLTSFVVNVILSLFLYHEFGPLGVPAATVITAYGVNVTNILRASRLLEVSFLKILPWWKMILRLLVAAVPGIALRYVYTRIHVDSFFVLFGIAMVYFGVYVLLTFSFGFLHLDDIKSFFRRKR